MWEWQQRSHHGSQQIILDMRMNRPLLRQSYATKPAARRHSDAQFMSVEVILVELEVILVELVIRY